MQQDVQMSNSILIVKKHRRADFDVAGGGAHLGPPSLHTYGIKERANTEQILARRES